MLTEKRKKEMLNAANKYSDTAIKVSTVAAARDFYNDYCDGKWSFDEHVVIMCLTQKYINNKCGAITREACLQEQKKLIRWLASGGNDEKKTAKMSQGQWRRAYDKSSKIEERSSKRCGQNSSP